MVGTEEVFNIVRVGKAWFLGCMKYRPRDCRFSKDKKTNRTSGDGSYSAGRRN